jgi:hypothetical protein
LLGNLGAQQGAITGYLSGALMPGSTNERIARGLQGMTQGQINDILTQQRMDALRAQRAQRGAAAGVIDPLVQSGQITPAQARFFAENPKAWEEYSKMLVGGGPVTTIGNTALQGTPFGAPRPVFREPMKSELVEEFDPETQRMRKVFKQPPEPFGGYGLPSNPVIPGRTPGTVAPGASWSAPSPQEKKEAETVGETFAKEYAEVQKQASAATGQRTVFQRMRQLNADPNLGQGALAPMMQNFRSALTTFGGDASKVKRGEEFTSLANQLVLESTGGSLGNQISNSDRDFIVARMPQLQNTRDGRAEMIETLDMLAKRKVEVAKEAQRYRKANGSLEGFQTHVADWAERNPLFKDRPTFQTQEKLRQEGSRRCRGRTPARARLPRRRSSRPQ